MSELDLIRAVVEATKSPCYIAGFFGVTCRTMTSLLANDRHLSDSMRERVLREAARNRPELMRMIKAGTRRHLTKVG